VIAERKSPAGPGGAVIGLRGGPHIKYMPAGGRLPVSIRAQVPDLGFARDTWQWARPAERRHMIAETWRNASRHAEIPGARSLFRRGLIGVPIFRIVSICGKPRNLAAWCPAGRLHFLYWPMRWGDSIKIGRAAGRLVIVDQLADGLTIHAATGAAVLVVFGLFNLAAITPERIRKRWPSQCLTYAPANGFNPPSAVGFSEPAAMARALGAGLAVLDSRDTWVSISNKSGLEGVRTAFDRNRLPLRSGVRS